LVILGPTASGKTQLACHLALELGGEIISADSRQLYRHMDIGTGKDLDEYEIDGVQIPYHLIDIHDPGYRYNIAEFQLDFLNCYEDIRKRGKLPVLCGGSGLYIQTALSGNSFMGIPEDKELRQQAESWSREELEEKYGLIDEEIRTVIPGDTSRRLVRALEIDQYLKANPNFESRTIPEINYKIVGVEVDRETRRNRITTRLKTRLDEGLIEEVKYLLDNFLTPDDLEYYGLEYKWVGQYLNGEMDKEQMFEKLNVSIHQFAKRQMTWFRRMEKQGYDIHWVGAEMEMERKVGSIVDYLNY